jgi:predicted permease
MVSLQVALSVLLLSAAGLFLQTLENYRQTDAGFDRKNLVTMRLTPPLRQSRETLLTYYERVNRSMESLPGFKGATMSSLGLLVDWKWSSGIHIGGMPVPEGDGGPLRNALGPRFFQTIGARFTEGRDFNEGDNRPDSPNVAIINESFRRRYFGSSSPLGRQIGPGVRPGENAEHFTIVGVVQDLRDSRINAAPERYWYVPLAQQRRIESVDVYVRMAGDLKGAVPAVRQAIANLDPGVGISQEGTVALSVEDQLKQERLVAHLSIFFAVVALLLAVIGLYGVMSYVVERRSKEIGIRMALGESRSEVLWRVLREAILCLGLGVIVGIPLSITLGRLSEKMLYGVKPADATSIGVAVAAILIFGLLAGWVTARRAASIEPLAALRIE